MLTKRRYHLVERCTFSIKEGQGPTLGVHQTTEHDARRLIHGYLQTDCDDPNMIETIDSNAVPPIPNRRERHESKIQ